MTLYNNDNLLLPPHVNLDSSQSEDDMAMEASQLMIRSPNDMSIDQHYHHHHHNHHHNPHQHSHNHPMSGHTLAPDNHPYKKLKYDPWSVDYMCSDPSSLLANAPLESIFEYSAFQLLPPNEQDELARLLPQVDTMQATATTAAGVLGGGGGGGGGGGVVVAQARTGAETGPLSPQQQHQHQPFPGHPQQQHGTSVSTTNSSRTGETRTIPPSFFSRDQNPIFYHSLDEWQLMLANGELSPASSAVTPTTPLQQHPPQPQRNNSFKDEAFEAYWGELNDRDKAHNVAGDSKNITLKDMCRKGLIRENDVIVYKRNFSACKVVVSKSMTVVKASGATGISIELDNEIFEDFETPTALETKILDQHGQVTKDKRPNGNAFKSIRLIRDGKDLGRLFDIRKDGFGETN